MTRSSHVRSVRVLVISDDSAGGHRAAGRAVVEALDQVPGAAAKLLDFYDLSPPGRRWAKGKLLIGGQPVLRPISRFLFSRAMNPGRLFKLAAVVASRMSAWSLRRFGETVGREKPDIVLSVHMGTNAASRHWEKERKLKAPVHSVITDYVAWCVWPSPHIARYYVATEKVKEDLIGIGVRKDRIQVTGIPVSPSLLARDGRSREALKRSLGLLPDLPVVLLMGGSLGDQQYEPIVRALDCLGIRAQVAVLCGRNEKLRGQLESMASGLRLPVVAKGFQENMAEWYRAADVVVTKPGGLTTSEVLATGKAMVLVNPYAGMEEEQVRRLCAAGVAVYGESAAGAARWVRAILEDARVRKRLERAAFGFSKPGAAFRIAEDLVRSSGISELQKGGV